MTAADTAAETAAETAARVDELLAGLRAGGDPRTAEAAEELTGSLVRLYGAGLARIVAAIGPERTVDLCADPLVESLLLIHDLHPLDVDTRIRRAVRSAWSGPGELDYLGCDADGVARLRLTAGAGCGSARGPALHAAEAAIRLAAPEVTGVAVDVPPPPPPLLQVGLRPGLGRPAVGTGS